MFNSQVLDVGIGLALLFAFMSLIATALKEGLETLFKARARMLEQGIRNILHDGDGVIAEKFFNSPLVSILFPGKYDKAKLTTNLTSLGGLFPAKFMKFGAHLDLPSYVPAANFALAMLSLAANSEGKPATVADVNNPDTGIFAQGSPPQLLIQQAMAAAGDDLAKARKYLEDWYDKAMDRVSGRFRRHAQYWLFGIGLLAAGIMNVDTITVSRYLMTDLALRQAVVSAAANLNDATKTDLAAVKTQLENIAYPIGWSDLPQLRLAANRPVAIPVPELPADPPVPSHCTYNKCIAALTHDPNFQAIALSMMFGWVITALAIMLGAPFWFDLLGKFMQVRSTLKPDPDKDKNNAAGNVPAAPVAAVVVGEA